MQCLGLDIGSSSIKGAVLDLANDQVQGIVQRPFPLAIHGFPSGWVEVEPQKIFAVAESVLMELLAEAPAAAAVFCSGQMGGVILVDDTGSAQSNYFSWRDQRTSQPFKNHSTHLEAIKARWQNNELTELGNELQAGSMTSLLFWLAKHSDFSMHQSTPSTIADYVLGKLCQRRPVLHSTQAIGLLDLNKKAWHRSAFVALDIDDFNWPELADSCEPFGHWQVNGRSIACYPSFGDQPCALRGIGLARNELSLNVSTGSQVSQRTEKFLPGLYQSRIYFHGDCLNTITHLPAGRSLNVLVNLLTELAVAQGMQPSDVWNYIARSSQNAHEEEVRLRQGNTSLRTLEVDLAFFAGPMGEHGHISGITTDNLNVGSLFNAAFDSMATNYLQCVNRLCSDRTPLTLALSGGLTRTLPLLRTKIAERLQMRLRDSAIDEETLLGLLDIAKEVFTIK